MFIHRQYNAVARSRLTRKEVNAKSGLENATSVPNLKLARASRIRLAKKTNTTGVAFQERSNWQGELKRRRKAKLEYCQQF